MPDAAAFQQRFGAALAGRIPAGNPILERALAVHRNTAAKAALDALADNYPVIRALVGDDAFTAAAIDYLAAHPPVEPRLCVYGETFAAFLGNYAPFAELPYLADVARVERMAVEALFAADSAPLDGTTFTDAVHLDRVLDLHPATRFAAFGSPAGTLWQAHQPDGDPEMLEALAWTEELVLVTRPFDALIVTVLPVAAAPFLAACAAGQPLGEAAALVPPGDLTSLFATLIAVGAFA
ncbi:MAG TPA: DNA-binding domain-containing protein [Sphingomonas sp.]|jgi:hypothetical protein|nr:DNA-binding domain-containing protein [Sphingomonas sp.]